jgi:O-6-methylguanine DNA methyltransferase
MTSFALFDSPIGTCGIAWSAHGICCLQLPDRDSVATESRLRKQAATALPAQPEAWVKEAIARIVRHLEGAPDNFTTLPLDLRESPDFHRRVYEASRAVGPGRTVTYGELATRVGSPGASRAVGQAMARNPVAILVPCHRVVASGGKPGGFSAHGGNATKARLLAIEGARLQGLKAEEATLSLFAGDGAFPFPAGAALRHVSGADKPLARTIERVGPFRLKLQSAHSPFDALVESILHQQITGKAAAAIAARLKATFGTEGYPSPEAVRRARVTKLRGAGLSASKALAVRDLAAKVADGTVPSFETMRGMEDEAIVERLTAVRGVGRWTVEMLLIFRLGRPDVLPVQDYGVRKGFARVFGTKDLPLPGAVARRGERWRPYRTVASWYLWRACELPPRVSPRLSRE